VTTSHRPPDDDAQQPRGPLARRIISLAGTPDDASDIDTRLAAIAQSVADTVGPVAYASITAVRDGAFTTVAASSELAVAVDEAQYAEKSGPCLDALADGTPVGVGDMDTTMAWPGFRRQAVRMGLSASLSVPLFAGSGVMIAALNLYGHDAVAMASLTARVTAVFDADPPGGADRDERIEDTSDADLIAGLAEAFHVRSLIQRAVGFVMARDRCTAEAAYLSLRVRAAVSGIGLAEIAAAVDAYPPELGNEPGA
jgi:GAF domain-containing protein/ANTAR domain-containing protein